MALLGKGSLELNYVRCFLCIESVWWDMSECPRARNIYFSSYLPFDKLFLHVLFIQLVKELLTSFQLFHSEIAPQVTIIYFYSSRSMCVCVCVCVCACVRAWRTRTYVSAYVCACDARLMCCSTWGLCSPLFVCERLFLKSFSVRSPWLLTTTFRGHILFIREIFSIFNPALVVCCCAKLAVVIRPIFGVQNFCSALMLTELQLFVG